MISWMVGHIMAKWKVKVEAWLASIIRPQISSTSFYIFPGDSSFTSDISIYNDCW